MAQVKRSYVAPVRAEQAAQTRRRVIDAATRAFSARGWTGTTLSEVARAARVTPQAVHLSVGAKPALLIAAVQSAVAGDQGDVPLIEREPFRSAYAAGSTPSERSGAFAAGTRAVYDRAGPLFLVLATAAPLDAVLADLWQRARMGRLEDCRRLVRRSGRRRAAERERIADIVFVLSGPGVHADLVGDRGWSGDAYQSWLAETLEPLLEP
jgi:AcrR family transcriptional regulator